MFPMPTSRIGIGCATLSMATGRDFAGGQATLHTALDGGIRLIDTAAAYVPTGDNPNHNEKLIAAALRTWDGPRDDVTVVTKSGYYRRGDEFVRDGNPRLLVATAELALKALEVDVLDVLLLHAPDPQVPIAESVGGLRQLLDVGKIRAAGVSNVSLEELREAQSACPIAVVQNRFSPDHPGRDVFDACESEGIAFMAYSPVGGDGGGRTLGERHPAFAQVAVALKASPQQVALAWEIGLGAQMFPVSGASRSETARNTASALDIDLDAESAARLSRAVFSAG
ncbi:MAG: aldo/keto reductase [Candidatus Dormibacteria bacterium]